MYHSDKPIEQFDEDLLGRATFAKQLADSILSIDLSDSFAIGIYGKWGTGKTSVLNLVQKEIEAKVAREEGNAKAIVMRFEPWNFSTCDQLLTQFFAQMAALVSADDKNEALRKVGSALEQYSSGFGFLELIPGIGPLVKIIPEIAKAFGKTLKESAEIRISNLAEKKQMVVDALRNQDCRIIVVIDDIDRLSNEQIRLIFQLVSSVAGFPNVVYVLSFDKDIVARALQTVQMDNGHEYLEKVIQVPFALPEVEKTKIIEVFIAKLNELLAQYPEIQINPDYWTSIFSSCISPYIATLRDVNRITNALTLKLALVKDEVNFADLSAITVFQTMRPWIYEWIKQNKTLLVGSRDSAEAFALEDSQRKLTKESIIQELAKEGGEEAENTFFSLVTLFPRLGSATNSYHTYASDDDLRKDRRIAHIEKFDLYTTLSLENIVLPSAKIRSAILECSEAEFAGLLLKLNEEQKAADFLMEVKSVIPQIPQERIPILTKALLENAYKLSSSRNISILSFRANYLALSVVKRLLLTIPDQESRKDILLSFLIGCSLDGLFSFADLLNTMELSHGRLAAKGNAQGEQIVSLEGILRIERVFMKRIAELFSNSKEDKILDPRALMLDYLWSCFDKESYERELNALFDTSESVFRYVAMFASNPRVIIGPAELTWQFSNGYEEFVSDEKIAEALEKTMKDHSFFNLDHELQTVMAAYKVWHTLGKNNFEDRVTEETVKHQINEWENTYAKQPE